MHSILKEQKNVMCLEAYFVWGGKHVPNHHGFSIVCGSDVFPS